METNKKLGEEAETQQRQQILFDSFQRVSNCSKQRSSIVERRLGSNEQGFSRTHKFDGDQRFDLSCAVHNSHETSGCRAVHGGRPTTLITRGSQLKVVFDMRESGQEPRREDLIQHHNDDSQ